MRKAFTKVHARRLTKLANHLLHGKLGHKKFDFSHYNWNPDAPCSAPEGCGTHGCSMGECPIAFPRQWAFKTETSLTYPVLKGLRVSQRDDDTVEGAKKFFGINAQEYRHLFIPRYGLKGNATRKQAGRHILRFVKDKLAGKYDVL